MKTITFAGILVILLTTSSALGENTPKKITFASESWAYATEEDGSGLYWDIFRSVYEPEGIDVVFDIRSYDESVEMLKEKKIDAMVGAYAHEVAAGIYPKHHFAVDIVQVVFKSSAPVKWAGQSTIESKRVGWIKGYSLDKYLIVNIHPMELRSRENAFKMLDTDEIDFLMDAAVDISAYLKRNRISPDKYQRKTLIKLKLYVVFTDNTKGKQLASIFDSRFNTLLKSGEIKTLYMTYINDKNVHFTYPFN